MAREDSVVKYSLPERPLMVMVPLPERRKTRATDVFRRPVPICCTKAANLIPLISLNRQLGGLLCLVRMLVAGVNVQLAIHLLPHFGFGKHARDSLLNHANGAGTTNLFCLNFAESTRITGMAAINLLLFF